MATNSKEPPLDEIQWRHPQLAQQMQGIHSNSVLFYFAESPFFDRTSNNAVLTSQAMHNANMFPVIQTREAFEGRLKTMSGLEFVVAQEPAEMAPGTGTGVWVIRKQTRRKRQGGDEDDVTVHATYYVVGDNIYMAPTLADILGFRMATISSALSKCFPAADSARTWSPSVGHAYKPLPSTNSSANPRARALESKEATPAPLVESQGTAATKKTAATATQDAALDARLAEQSFYIHMQYGGDYMDQNPITGKPGDFHLSSTGRKPDIGKLQISPPGGVGLPASSFGGSGDAKLAGGSKAAAGKDEKGGATTPKTPKTPTGSLPAKPKRRKSKQGTTTPTSS
ncbi:hypothetical protein DL771_003711 [Monosporascus sp. 5C6A]|nr:hypothetical protein DL771_003711 [Monosporascus sp. 5C6A]